MGGYVKPYKPIFGDKLPCIRCKKQKPDSDFKNAVKHSFRRKRGTYCLSCRVELHDGMVRRANGWKQKAYDLYGRKCACCSEKNELFFQIDHTQNNGNVMRKSRAHPTGWCFFRWLVKNGGPSGFQILCANCNWGKFRNGGVCPHKNVKAIQ